MNPLQTNTKSNTRVEQQTQTQTKEKQYRQIRPSDTKECPNCHAKVKKNYEFCPNCGKKLVDYCTFCGASMGRNDTVCEECGMPAEGVTCPKCGTINVRSFCRQCDEPLNKAALRALEKAKQDPKVQKAAALMDKAAELEEKIERLKSGKTEKKAPAVKTITEAERIFMEMFGTKAETAETVQEVEETESLEQLEQEYQSVVQDINDVLASFTPPSGCTPQEEFGFYSAQKIAVETTRKVKSKVVKTVRSGWVCNFCGCWHKRPADCAEPKLGGTWQYEDILVDVIVDQKVTTYKYE